MDDEGTPTQKTVLIENGILNNYLSDRIGAGQVGISRTGSARRESYKFAPVSRMRNTFIAPGPHEIEEMLRSIKFGLYAKKMGGGSLSGTKKMGFGRAAADFFGFGVQNMIQNAIWEASGGRAFG